MKIFTGLYGRKSRNERLVGRRQGSAASSHVDFLILIERLVKHSIEYAQQHDGNVSPYTLAAIPLMISMIRALVIDCEVVTLKPHFDLECLRKDGDICSILSRYQVEGDLRRDAESLVEIRNEIIHPTHISLGTKDNWPEYLRAIKEAGLLNSTNKEDSDYDFMHQLNSHRLLKWAQRTSWNISKQVLQAYVTSYKIQACMMFLRNFGF
ncbi:MAG: hypothetical protein ACRESQ_02370 [Gammaproteobacteria bacterium]